MAEQDLTQLIAQLDRLEKELNQVKAGFQSTEQAAYSFLRSLRKGGGWRYETTQKQEARREFIKQTPALEPGKRYTAAPGQSFTATQREAEEYNILKTRAVTLSSTLDKLSVATQSVSDAIRKRAEEIESNRIKQEFEKELDDLYSSKVKETASIPAAALRDIPESKQRKTTKTDAEKQAEKDARRLAEELKKAAEQAARLVAVTKENPELRGRLEQHGFTPDKPQFRVSQDVDTTSGIRKTHVQYYDQLSGAMQRTTVVQNKHNKILNDTQKRYRDLTSAIARDITEVFKWTIAVGLVYGPLRKLQDLIQIAIENQAKLADIAVVLGKSQADLGAIFNTAADAAREMGEPLNGVIDAYDLAYRAAGKYTDQATRTRMANQLLRDSLLLSKLAGMEQADAMDVLVGALQQLGKELDYGDTLINKWVAVSRQANVSVEDMATSFSITATAAENVGLSVDELNGLIASLATAMGGMSSSEVGNAIRAFVTGFQSEGAISALQQFGIAVQDTEGNTRDFLSVLKDVAELSASGLISDAQLNKLATALGGQGARRGPQMAAILKSIGMSNDLAAVSANATTEAYDALEIKLDTVETKITNLANAFQQLAESLGENGGVLDVVSAVLDVATTLVDTLTKVSDALGPLAPLFGVGAVGMFLANNSNKFDLSSLTAGGAFGAKVKPPVADTEGWAWSRQQPMGGINSKLLGIAAIVPQLVSIASQAKKGENVGNELGATVVGGALGFMAAGPLGATLGAAIGNIFVETVLEREGEFENFFNETIKGATEKPGKGNTVEDRFTEEMFTQYGGGSNEKGKLKATIQAGIANLAAWAGNLLGTTEGLGTVTPEQIALYNRGDIGENAYRLQKIEEQRRSSLGTVVADPTSVFGQETASIMTRNVEIINRILEDQRQKLIEKARDQEITAKEYEERIGQLSSRGVDLVSIYQVVGDALGTTEEAFKSIANVIYSSTEDQRSYITALITEIASLEEELRNLQKEGKNTDDVLEQLSEKKQIVVEYTVELAENIHLQEIKAKVKPVVEFDDTTMKEFQKQLELAYQLQKYEALEIQKLTPEEAQLLADSYTPFFVSLANGFQEVTGLGQDYLKKAGDMLSEAGQGPSATNPFDITTIDSSPGAFKAAYNKMFEFIKQRFPEYQFKTEEMGVIFNDNVTETLHLDNLVMQLAMQELIDVNEKQLDGLYNLPSGADFFVPFETMQYAYNAGLNAAAGGGKTGPDYSGEDYTKTAFGEDEEKINKILDYSPKSDFLLEDKRNIPTWFKDWEKSLSEKTKPADLPANPYVLTEEQRRLLSGTGEDSDKFTATNPTLDDNFRLLERNMIDFIKNPIDKLTEAILNWVNGDPDKTRTKTGINKSGDITSLSQESTSQSMVTELRSLNTNMATAFGLDIPTAMKTEKPIATSFTEPKVSPLNLNLDSTSTINLIVDGRVLAQVVSTYLYEELLRFADVAGSINRRIVSV